MIRPLISAAIALGLSMTAFAGTSITAKLETPTDRAVKVVAANTLWKCVENTCTATIDRNALKLSTCKQVVKSLGKVSAYSTDTKTLSETKLEKCNAVAKS